MAALDLNAGNPILFRTYRAPQNKSFDCKIWEAGRATTATPSFFEQIRLGAGGTAVPYVDGGLGRNNPISVVLDEAELVFPKHQINCIISIGCGQAATIAIPKPGWFGGGIPTNVIDAVFAMAHDCERSQQETAKRFAKTPGVYFRFNVEQGMQEIGVDDWKRMDKVTSHTIQYLKLPEVNRKVKKVVTLLRNKHVT